ncbi:arginase family protein [Allosalinactinospora lopnorensis]|uniref:arginase family protein n=1 Tax=Allosalinactinospora lopnorensis TaxID=1352348 RepID=UPI000623CADB|nr:arginase family protein [Allosalinactinospora lopnorensis]
MELHLAGVPFNSSGTPGGVAMAPAALREAGLAEALGRSSTVHDAGDVGVGTPEPRRSPRSGLLNEAALVEMTANVRREAALAHSHGRRPFLVGGDCPILLGGLAAARDARASPVGLLFIDGHEDAWPPKASTTGEGADAELGIALADPNDEAYQGLPDRLAAMLPLLDPAAVVVLGPRDAAELAQAGVPRLPESHPDLWLRTADDLAAPDSGGRAPDLVAAVTAATDRIRRNAPAWWLHTDLDVLSTEALPAVDYPQEGGLSWEQLTILTKAALSTPGCAGWSITIYNPELDPDGQGARRIVRYAAEALASRPG